MRNGWSTIRGLISPFPREPAGIDHLGIQVDSDAELIELRAQVKEAQIPAQDQPNAECRYARSDIYWTTDPQGIAWETFHTLESIPLRGKAARPESEACCGAGLTDSSPKESSSCCR